MQRRHRQWRTKNKGIYHTTMGNDKKKHTSDWTPPRHAKDHGIPWGENIWYHKFEFHRPTKSVPYYRLLLKLGRVGIGEGGLALRGAPRLKAFEIRPWLIFY